MGRRVPTSVSGGLWVRVARRVPTSVSGVVMIAGFLHVVRVCVINSVGSEAGGVCGIVSSH